MANQWEVINSSSIQYSTVIAPVVREICDPLVSYLGIDFFVYQKYYDNGYYLSLSNNLNFNQFYIKHIQGLSPTFLSAIKMVKENDYYYFLWPLSLEGLNIAEEVILFKAFRIGIWNGLSIYKKNKNTVESWSFAPMRGNTSIISYYLNNKYKLKHFILYFNERARNFINSSSNAQLSIFKKITSFSEIIGAHDENEDGFLNQKTENFLQKTPIFRKFIKGKHGEIFLTIRETECMKYLCLGKSLKEIGKILGLSPRTIEFYLNNIKNKSGIQSKEELLINFTLNSFPL